MKGIFAAVVSVVCAVAQVHGDNLLTNSELDTTITSWSCSLTNGTATWDPLDVDGAPDSGSLRVDHSAPSDNSKFICYQCAPAIAGEQYRLSSWAYFADEPGFTLDGSVRIQILYSDDLDCVHAISFGDVTVLDAHAGIADQWNPVTTNWSAAPEGTVAAAAITFVWANTAGNALRFQHDSIVLENPHLFSDGFETGNLEGWSSFSP